MAGVIFSRLGKRPVICVKWMLTRHLGAGQGAAIAWREGRGNWPALRGQPCRCVGGKSDLGECKGMFPGRAERSGGQGRVPGSSAAERPPESAGLKEGGEAGSRLSAPGSGGPRVQQGPVTHHGFAKLFETWGK